MVIELNGGDSKDEIDFGAPPVQNDMKPTTWATIGAGVAVGYIACAIKYVSVQRSD